MISLKKLSKTFGETRVLDNINLDFGYHKTTALIGPSGCGKSTILRLITGLLEPTSGHIEFDGNIITPQNIQEIRQKIGYVIQDGGLFPHLTATQNVSIMAKHVGWDKIKIHERVNELSDLTAFPKDALERYPLQLSGGQKQRLSLMRALMLDPQVLLLDEPLDALDPHIRHYLQSDLKQIFKQLNKTVVLVTHNMEETAFLGDHIVFLMGGKIAQQGSYEELIHNPKNQLIAEFFTTHTPSLSK